MNISGVIVRARPERAAAVREELLRIPGVTLHADAGNGRMVITVEDGPEHSVEDSLLRVHVVEGLLCASLVYQYSNDSLEEGAIA